MPCLVVLLGLFAPRVVSVVLWLFTSWFAKPFGQNPLLLILGIVFLPFTTLAYAWAVNTDGGVRGPFWIVVMIVAVLMDLSSFEGGRRHRGRVA